MSVPNVINDIIGGAIPYTVDTMLDGINVYNYLPIETKRDAIHQVVFAYGISILKDANGDLVFGFLDQTTAKRIPDNSIFLNGKSTHTPPATKIEVLEHSYFKKASDAVVILFDNSEDVVPAQNTFVAFQEAPVYDIAATGLTLHSSSVNYAIVSGIGTITGKKYNHQTNRVSRSNANASGEEKLITSEGCTLVSMLNSSNVLRRLLSYYSSDQTFTIDLAVTSEKPGDQITFTSPFGDTVTAFLASMQITASTFMKARCSLVKDFVPLPPGGGDYSHVVVITQSGTWTVPNGIVIFTAVLIQGGQGGQGGYNGNDANNSESITIKKVPHVLTDVYTEGTPGANGGLPGNPGSGGKVKIIKFDVEGPDGQCNIIVGSKGSGGANNGGIGSYGGHSTISFQGRSASSSDGYTLDDGYYDVISKIRYAVNGGSGVQGESGGNGGTYRWNKNSSGSGAYIDIPSSDGGSAGIYNGGAKANRIEEKFMNYYYPESTDWYKEQYSEEESSANAKMAGYLVSTDIPLRPFSGVFEQPGHPPDYEVTMPANYKDSPAVHNYLDSNTITKQYFRHKNNPETFTKRTYYYHPKGSLAGSKKYAGGGGGGAAHKGYGSDAYINSGGNGADASLDKDISKTYGSGGSGGNGGGGGGGAGGNNISMWVDYNNTDETVSMPSGAGGKGGKGSAGDDGAQGCVLIYY